MSSEFPYHFVIIFIRARPRARSDVLLGPFQYGGATDTLFV